MNGPARSEAAWRRAVREWTALRRPAPIWQSVLLAILCIAVVFSSWWFVTRGEPDARIVGPLTLPSPKEAFDRFPEFWGKFDTPENARRTLLVNTLVTLRRVTLGFLLALVVGVPLGIAAGCYSRLAAFIAPLVLFGRNIPLAAVVGLMVFIFGTGERGKVMFIFVATVAFIVSDASRAIADVSARYIDTAYTLGANRWQTIMKVLVPLALPSIFGSARVLFGLSFGYIMLAEMIRGAEDVGGLGNQIQVALRRSDLESIYLILITIPIVALFVDRMLYWIQRELFPHVYGGDGYLHQLIRFLAHRWDDLKYAVLGGATSPESVPRSQSSAEQERT